MKKRIHKKQIKELIKHTIQSVQMDQKVREDATNVNMSYDFIEDRVYFDFNRVQEACKEMAYPVPLETYIKTLTIHELGHAMDRGTLLNSMDRLIEIAKLKRKHSFAERRENPELFAVDIESHQLEISFEETAWEHAEYLNRTYQIVDWDSFYKIKEHSMASYLKYYEKDLATYRKLVVESRMTEREVVVEPALAN